MKNESSPWWTLLPRWWPGISAEISNGQKQTGRAKQWWIKSGESFGKWLTFCPLVPCGDGCFVVVESRKIAKSVKKNFRESELVLRQVLVLGFFYSVTSLLDAGARFICEEAILQERLVVITALLFCAIYLANFGSIKFLFKWVILHSEMR